MKTPGDGSRRLGWFLVTMLAGSTFLNYIDRQTLALLTKPIQADLMINDLGYALVVNCFMVAYTLGNLTSDKIISRFGAMRALPIFVVGWSIAGAMCGLVQHTTELAFCRFVLGIFETGNFIAAPIIVSLYLPSHQRALGVAIYTAAAMFGAAVSPPLITQLYNHHGWRPVFIIMGAAGIAWSIAWWIATKRSSTASQCVTQESRASDQNAVEVLTWRQAALEPKVWAYALGAMFTFPVWFFYLNWFPKYLTDERGLSTLDMGSRAWVVYFFAGIGCMVAGGIVGFLVRRRLPPVRARLLVLGAVSIAAPIGAINYFEPSLQVTLGSAACVALLHMIWQTTLSSLPIELFTSRSLSKVYGVAGVASGLGSVLSTWLIGQLVSIVSYKPMFVVMGVVYLIAIGIILTLLRQVRKVRLAS